MTRDHRVICPRVAGDYRVVCPSGSGAPGGVNGRGSVMDDEAATIPGRQAAIYRLTSSLTAVRGYAQLLDRHLRDESLDRERLIEMSDKLDGYLADFEAQLAALLGALPPE
jgi:hypothetical protein